jgi:hypothetical protein
MFQGGGFQGGGLYGIKPSMIGWVLVRIDVTNAQVRNFCLILRTR